VDFVQRAELPIIGALSMVFVSREDDNAIRGQGWVVAETETAQMNLSMGADKRVREDRSGLRTAYAGADC
jgi:hypothetical protein